MICRHGGLSFVCHNDLRVITAFVTVLLSSHIFNHSVEKYLLLDQITDKMIPELTSMFMDFAGGGKVPFLI